MYQYPYLVGIIILGLLWLIFFLLRKDLRQQILIMSFFTTPLAPIFQFFFFSKDYWNPNYFYSISINGVSVGIEEPLFAFFVGGIGTIIYEVIRNRISNTDKSKPRPLIATLVIVTTIVIFLLLKLIQINTIWASVIALILGSILILIIDRDLIYDSIFSGLFFVILSFCLYLFLLHIYPNIFKQLWISKGLSGINIFKIPIEEIFWFFSWGLFSGVIYEFWINVKKYDKK